MSRDAALAARGMNAVITMPHLYVTLVTVITVLTAIMLHYEALNIMYKRMERLHWGRRARMVLLISVIVCAHVLEIGLFGVVYWLMLKDHALGSITGVVVPELMDCFYFSATTFTTVGYGDLVFNGPIRILAGTEALVGLVMITWSASFTLGEMQREWKR